MEIKDFLAPSHVVIGLRVPDKTQLIDALARQAGAALGLPPDVISGALQRHEELGSTGIGGGVAFPHARLSELSRPFGMLARLGKPIAFDAIDGKPVDLVFLLLLPANALDGQLGVLACAARALRVAEVLRELRRAGDSAAAFRALVAKGEQKEQGA